MVRKKWLSSYFGTYWCYIHQTCTYCSSWHDLLIPCGGLCPWPSFHAWVTWWLGRNCYVHITVTIGATFTKLAPTVHFDMIYSYHVVILCPWPTFHASVTKTQTVYSRAPVMVPIIIMSSLGDCQMQCLIIYQKSMHLWLPSSLKVVVVSRFNTCPIRAIRCYAIIIKLLSSSFNIVQPKLSVKVMPDPMWMGVVELLGTQKI